VLYNVSEDGRMGSNLSHLSMYVALLVNIHYLLLVKEHEDGVQFEPSRYVCCFACEHPLLVACEHPLLET
jgi:hypothetical protein